ncbi:MAG: cell envelope-related transcriptional attenuator [Mycobacterium sp.]|nr:cell envelope-related transcriptional attenuator [Mycobacterium sp.]
MPETPTRNQPAPSAANGELVDAVTTSPGDITVRVSNSTGESGLATVAANELKQHGFNITDPDDYPGPLASTTEFFSAGNEQAAATVASSFSNPTIERVTGMGTTIRVVLGSDFASVAPPTPSGSPIQVHVLKGTSSEPTHLPEDLTVTNAADTTCE